MKTLTGLLVGLVLFVAGSSVALAQENAASAEGASPPPKVLLIQREFVKPGRGHSVHDKSESAFVRAMEAAHWPKHYFAMNSLSGAARTLFFTGYDSFADWEKDNTAMDHDAKLSAALGRASLADGDLLSAGDSSVWTFDPDESLNASVRIADFRYMEILVLKVRPGHRDEFKQLTKVYKDGFSKVPNARFVIFHSQYGTDNGGLSLVITPMKSLAEIDQGMVDSKQFADALGAEGLKKLTDLSAACLESSQQNLFEFSPKMSYPPAAWVAENPEFWKPKSEAPAKQPPAKPAQ